MAQRVNHDHPDTENRDSGADADSVNFARHYRIEPPFDINCIVCCFKYLVGSREYQYVDGNSYQVKFGRAIDWTDCFLLGPKGRRKHGQFSTGKDINLGTVINRAIQSGLTYQFYTNNEHWFMVSLQWVYQFLHDWSQ